GGARVHRGLERKESRAVVERARPRRGEGDGSRVRGAWEERVTPDLVLLGNLLVDDVVFPDGRTRMGQPGGAILYASLATALWGARAGCVSVRGDDYPK